MPATKPAASKPAAKRDAKPAASKPAAKRDAKPAASKPAAKRAAKPAAAKPAPQQRAAHGKAALDGLEISLDEAQKAITELRRDLSTGGRQLVKDVEAAVKSARRDLDKTRKAIQGDLGDLGDALTPRRGAGAE